MEKFLNPDDHFNNSISFDKCCLDLVNSLVSYEKDENSSNLLNSSINYILNYIAYQIEHSDDFIETPKSFDTLISFCSRQKNANNLGLKNYCIYLSWALELLDWVLVRKYMPNNNHNNNHNNNPVSRFDQICIDIIKTIRNDNNIEVKVFDDLAEMILEGIKDPSIFNKMLDLNSYKDLVVLSTFDYNNIEEISRETDLQIMSIFKILEICKENINTKVEYKSDNTLIKN